MARPKPDAQRVVTTMRLDKSLLKRIASVADREGRSRSNLVEHILRAALMKRDKARAEADVLG